MKKIIVIPIFFLFLLILPLSANAADELCCPAGYSSTFTACPVFTDRGTTCCRRNGPLNYDKTPKIACTAAAPKEATLCCPQGFGTGFFDCPFGVDIAKQCCYRRGSEDYKVVDKIQCDADNADTSTNTIYSVPPKYCSQWVDPATGNDIPATSPLVTELKAECKSISTAIGDVSTDPAKFTQRIFSLVLGLAGGIALLLIIIAGYRFMASQGDPEKITEARQQLISAIVGLLFIIFSFVILQVIGVDILKIPGFSK